jgi:hypothetical protein
MWWLELPNWFIWAVAYEKSSSLKLDNIRLLKIQKFWVTQHSDFSLEKKSLQQCCTWLSTTYINLHITLYVWKQPHSVFCSLFRINYSLRSCNEWATNRENKWATDWPTDQTNERTNWELMATCCNNLGLLTVLLASSGKHKLQHQFPVMTQTISKISDLYSVLIQVITQEEFTAFNCCEKFRFYNFTATFSF